MVKYHGYMVKLSWRYWHHIIRCHIMEIWSNQMLDTCYGFLLFLHNLAFGEDPELNGSIWFVAVSVSRQSVSWYCVNVSCQWMSKLVAFQFSIHLIFSKAPWLKLLCWSPFYCRMDDGTFGSVLSPFGFKVETDNGNLGMNERFAPFWLLGTCNLSLDSCFDQWLIWWCYSSSVVASDIVLGETSVVNCFVWSVAVSVQSSQFPVSRFETV